MFSRLAIRSALQAHKSLSVMPQSAIALRLNSNIPTADSNPERDLVNFPRPKRLEVNAPVRYMFIPEEWFEFFYKKTGVTGPYVFGGGVTTYLLSKEIWVRDHEMPFVVAFFILVWGINRLFGAQIKELMLKMTKEDLDEALEAERHNLKSLKEAIEHEKKAQWMADGQMLLFDVKRENVALQIESIYRERAMQVYTEVKKRLDFQLEIENIERRIAQKHMVQWIIQNVLKSITAQQEKDTLKKCIVDLQGLAARA